MKANIFQGIGEDWALQLLPETELERRALKEISEKKFEIRNPLSEALILSRK